jgi:hypothetical protein
MVTGQDMLSQKTKTKVKTTVYTIFSRTMQSHQQVSLENHGETQQKEPLVSDIKKSEDECIPKQIKNIRKKLDS